MNFKNPGCCFSSCRQNKTKKAETSGSEIESRVDFRDPYTIFLI